MSDLETIQTAMIEIGARIYRHRYVVATDGNISVRMDSDRFLMTATNCCKGELAQEDLLICNGDGLVSGNGKLSSESRLHFAVYRSRPDVNAIIHAHPPYAVALSLIGSPPPAEALPELKMLFGEIPLSEFAIPGSEALASSAASLMMEHDAIILDRHGSLTVGSSLEEAFYKLERLEFLCRIYYLAKLAGEPRLLTDNELTEIDLAAKEYRGLC